MQIRADILGRPLERAPLADAAAFGAALLAGQALDGAQPGPARAFRGGGDREVFEPDQRRHALYEARLDAYETLYGKLIGIAHALEP